MQSSLRSFSFSPARVCNGNELPPVLEITMKLASTALALVLFAASSAAFANPVAPHRERARTAQCTRQANLKHLHGVHRKDFIRRCMGPRLRPQR